MRAVDWLRGDTSQAVLIAVAVDGEGCRQVLAAEVANRESRSSWRDFPLDLKQRGLHGVEFAVSDDHPGLKAAIRERERQKEAARREKQRKRRDLTIAKAEAALAEAQQIHEARIAAVEQARTALDKKLQVEDENWRKQQARLEAILERIRG